MVKRFPVLRREIEGDTLFTSWRALRIEVPLPSVVPPPARSSRPGFPRRESPRENQPAMLRLLRWLHRNIEGLVLWLDTRRLLGWTQGALALVMFAIPTAADFSLVKNHAWYAGAVACALLFGGLEVYEARLDGAAFDRAAQRLAEIHGCFAGSIDSIRADLLASRGHKLAHDHCNYLCAGLLRRIRDYAAVVFEQNGRVRLRATLLVPLRNPATGEVETLKVWCYDDHHRDRGNTEIPLYVNKVVVPGAPRAYLSGQIDFLPDVHEVTTLPALRKPPYRAVVAFPLDALDPATGRPIAVVCLDADEPHYFDVRVTVETLHPIIAPALNTVGLVLALRNKGQDYVFPR